MANTIQVKRSAVAGKVPTTSDLALGELAINTYDGKLYLKKDDGTQAVIEVGGGGGGSGDVVGPASSTDKAITRFDGTTGKLIQNSTATLSDDGTFANVNAVVFDTSPTTPTTEGSLYWDSADGIQTLNVVMAGGDVVQQIGEETYYRIKASSAITNGQVVMFTGTVGASGGLTGAPATGLTAATAYAVMGIATEDIALNDWGYVTSFGLVRGIDTSSFSNGQILYLNPSVAGGLTATVPSAPNPKVQVCAVVYAAGNGSLFVRPSFGGTLGQFEGDVDITSPASGNTLIYNASAGKWVNANLTDGTGISITEGAGTITVTNTAPDQTVALTSGTGISTSGTYPNFTITNTAPDQTVALTAGTGISTSGTYPNFTITNSDKGSSQNIFKNIAVSGQTTVVADTNDDTLTLAAGTGISLTTNATTDTVTIAATNNGTVTSVGVSVPTGLSVSGSPVTSSGTIAISYTAGYSIPTTTSQTNWDTAYSDRLKWDGGSTGLTASTGRTSLGATTLGSNLFTITNPSAVTFPRFNADNTVSALDAATFRTAIGAGTSSTTGTVTSVAAGSYLTGGTITTSGTLAVDATSANTASKVVARDASGNFSAGTITAALSGNATTATSATTATTLATGHTIGMTGDVTYTSGSFNGSADVTGTATLANSGVTAGTYTNATVTVDAKGRVTSASSGSAASGTVTSVAVSGTNITVSGSPITTSGTISISIPQAITTTSSVQFGSFGVGTAASGTSGEIRATNNITAYYSSDANLKENVRDIPNALNTVLAIGGKLFDWKDSYIEQHGGEDGYFVRKSDFGVIAQDVQKVFPIAVRTRDDGTLAVDYEKLCALAFSAIIELANEVRK